MEFLLVHKRDLLRKSTCGGSTIAHWAAASGNPEVLLWVLKHEPSLVDKTDDDGRNILHYAAMNTGQKPEKWFIYFFENYPTLTKKLWTRCKNGETPHDLARTKHYLDLNKIRDNSLLAATNRIIAGTPFPRDNDALVAFHEEWKSLILQSKEGFLKQGRII
jgi:hypothetical protein